MNNVFCCS